MAKIVKGRGGVLILSGYKNIIWQYNIYLLFDDMVPKNVALN